MPGISVSYKFNNTTYSTTASRFNEPVISTTSVVYNIPNVPLFSTTSNFVQCTNTTTTLGMCSTFFLSGEVPTYSVSSNSLIVSNGTVTLSATDIFSFVGLGEGWTFFTASDYSPRFIEYTSSVTTPNSTLYFMSETLINVSQTNSSAYLHKYSVNSLGSISIATALSSETGYENSQKTTSTFLPAVYVEATGTASSIRSSASDIYSVSYKNVTSRSISQESFFRQYENWVTSSDSQVMELNYNTSTIVDYRYLTKTADGVPLSSYTDTLTKTTFLFSSDGYIKPVMLSGYSYSSYSYFTSTSTWTGGLSSSNLTTIQFTGLNSGLFTQSHTFSTSSVDGHDSYSTTSILPIWNMMLEIVTSSEALQTVIETSSTVYPFDGAYSSKVVNLGFFSNLAKITYTLSSGYTSSTMSSDTVVSSSSELSTTSYASDTMQPSSTSSSAVSASTYSATTSIESYYSTYNFNVESHTLSVTHSSFRRIISTTSYTDIQTLYSLNSSVDGEFYTYETVRSYIYGDNVYMSTEKDVAMKNSFISSITSSEHTQSSYNSYTYNSTYYSSLFSTYRGPALTTTQLISTNRLSEQLVSKTNSASEMLTSQSSVVDTEVIDDVITNSSVSLYFTEKINYSYFTTFDSTYSSLVSEMMTDSYSVTSAKANTNVGTIFKFSTINSIINSSSIDLMQSISYVTSKFIDRVEQVWAYSNHASTISTYSTTLTTSFSSYIEYIPIFTQSSVLTVGRAAKTSSFTGYESRFIINKTITSAYESLETVVRWAFNPEPEISTISTVSTAAMLETSSAKSTIETLTSTADFTTISSLKNTSLVTGSSGRFINSSSFIISTISEQQNDTLMFKTTYNRFSYYYCTNYSSTLKTIGDTISVTTFTNLYVPNKFTTTVGETMQNSATSSYSKSTTAVNVSSYTTTWMPIYYDVDGIYITE